MTLFIAAKVRILFRSGKIKLIEIIATSCWTTKRVSINLCFFAMQWSPVTAGAVALSVCGLNKMSDINIFYFNYIIELIAFGYKLATQMFYAVF